MNSGGFSFRFEICACFSSTIKNNFSRRKTMAMPFLLQGWEGEKGKYLLTTLSLWSLRVQTRAAKSLDAPTTMLSPWSNSTDMMAALLPVRMPRHSGPDGPASHSLTLRSAPPVANRRPLGLHRIAFTSPSWASCKEGEKDKREYKKRTGRKSNLTLVMIYYDTTIGGAERGGKRKVESHPLSLSKPHFSMERKEERMEIEIERGYFLFCVPGASRL